MSRLRTDGRTDGRKCEYRARIREAGFAIHYQMTRFFYLKMFQPISLGRFCNSNIYRMVFTKCGCAGNFWLVACDTLSRKKERYLMMAVLMVNLSGSPTQPTFKSVRELDLC